MALDPVAVVDEDTEGTEELTGPGRFLDTHGRGGYRPVTSVLLVGGFDEGVNQFGAELGRVGEGVETP